MYGDYDINYEIMFSRDLGKWFPMINCIKHVGLLLKPGTDISIRFLDSTYINYVETMAYVPTKISCMENINNL